ncbi:MAG TPA: RidA family protein [Candidatus Binatia bacterium]|jgi:enamine deaminase RidA (YjgF/YER057c/UK114 family)|nr:RidA family protein [Candidatus Binatia bacterium]
MTTPTERLAALSLPLPPPPPTAGSYVNAVRSGSLLFLAGHAPIRADGSVILGKLGSDLTTAEGYDAARVAALGALATMLQALGSLDRVQRIVRVYGVVNATPEFTEHTPVVNGASDLFGAVFGDAGAHARLAVGVSSLPWNIALEIEVTAEVG